MERPEKKWCGNCKWGQRIQEPLPNQQPSFLCHAPMSPEAPQKSKDCPDDSTGYPGWEPRGG